MPCVEVWWRLHMRCEARNGLPMSKVLSHANPMHVAGPPRRCQAQHRQPAPPTCEQHVGPQQAVQVGVRCLHRRRYRLCNPGLFHANVCGRAAGEWEARRRDGWETAKQVGREGSIRQACTQDAVCAASQPSIRCAAQTWSGHHCPALHDTHHVSPDPPITSTHLWGGRAPPAP